MPHRRFTQTLPSSPPGVFGRTASALEGRTILQIVPRLEGGGAEQTTLDIAGALVDAGARALVASEGGRLVADLQTRGGIFLPYPAATKNPIAMMGAAGQLRRLIQAEGVDLVHVRSRAPAWVALRVCRALGVPLVTTWHGAHSGQSAIKQRYNSVMARGDVVIANSLWTADLIRKTYPDATPRIATIPRGIDLRRFAPGDVDPERVRRLRKAWNVSPEERIVLVPARLARRKGHLVVVEAARRLAQKGFGGLVFVMAGDAGAHMTVRRDIERAAASAGLAGQILCTGFCDDMPAAYLAAAVVVVSSVEPESFGRVAVEAQAMGAPVLVTDLGAARETVLAPPEATPAARTGWRVKPGDAAALADAVAEVLPLGAAAREALAERASTHVSAKFSVDRMGAATLELYDRLLLHHAAVNAATLG